MFGSVPLEHPTASEFVHVANRSVRTEVRRCVSKEGQLDNIPGKLTVFLLIPGD